MNEDLMLNNTCVINSWHIHPAFYILPFIANSLVSFLFSIYCVKMYNIYCFGIKSRLKNSNLLVKYQKVVNCFKYTWSSLVQNLPYILILEIEVLNSSMIWPLVCFWFLMIIELLVWVSVLYISIRMFVETLLR